MKRRPIPTRLWSQIADAAGGLPDKARRSVTDAINSCGIWGTGIVVRSDVREVVANALKSAAELSRALQSLEQNPEFLDYGMDRKRVSVADLSRTLTQLRKLEARLKVDTRRLKQRSARGWPVIEASELVIDLLEIRSDFLNTGLPTDCRDNTPAGPFLQYVKLCVRHADSKLTEKQIGQAIDDAVRQLDWASRKKSEL